MVPKMKSLPAKSVYSIFKKLICTWVGKVLWLKKTLMQY